MTNPESTRYSPIHTVPAVDSGIPQPPDLGAATGGGNKAMAPPRAERRRPAGGATQPARVCASR